MSLAFVALLVVCSVCSISQTEAGCYWIEKPNHGAGPNTLVSRGVTAEQCKEECVNLTATGNPCYAVLYAEYMPNDYTCFVVSTPDFVQAVDLASNLYIYICPACESSPCQNDGQCTETSTGYQCTCTDLFTGTNCETPICRNLNILTDASKANCTSTNYPGNAQDFFTQDNNIWNYSLPSVTFSFSNTPTIRKISYDNANNLQAMRARVKTTNGDVWTQSTTGKSLTVNVQLAIEVTIYFAPSDITINVTVSGLAIQTCPGGLLGGLTCNPQSLLNLFEALVTALFGGIISFGSNGKANVTVGFQAPYVDVNLITCLGISASEFSQISFGQVENITSISVLVSNSSNGVPVTDDDGNLNPLPYTADGITLAEDIVGDHITLKITPQTLSIQQPIASFSFTKLVITIC